MKVYAVIDTNVFVAAMLSRKKDSATAGGDDEDIEGGGMKVFGGVVYTIF